MSKMGKFIVALVLGLMLSLTLFTSGTFAQSVKSSNTSKAAQVTVTSHAAWGWYGPYGGFGRFGQFGRFGGYGGLGGWFWRCRWLLGRWGVWWLCPLLCRVRI